MATHWRRNNLTKQILLRLAEAGMFTIAATSPYFLHRLVKAYFREQSIAFRRRAAQRLRELSERKLTEFKELGGGTVRVVLTHQGKRLVRQYNLDEMSITRPKRWDRQWRLIVYDIPHSAKKARDAFRMKLKEFNLYPLQKSVWVSAYECLPELEFLASVFDIDFRHILYFTVPRLPGEEKLKQWFEL